MSLVLRVIPNVFFQEVFSDFCDGSGFLPKSRVGDAVRCLGENPLQSEVTQTSWDRGHYQMKLRSQTWPSSSVDKASPLSSSRRLLKHAKVKTSPQPMRHVSYFLILWSDQIQIPSLVVRGLLSVWCGRRGLRVHESHQVRSSSCVPSVMMWPRHLLSGESGAEALTRDQCDLLLDNIEVNEDGMVRIADLVTLIQQK